MNRPSKKEIKAALEKLHKPAETQEPTGYMDTPLETKNRAAAQKRIRKKGI